jgi:hypothetical protein
VLCYSPAASFCIAVREAIVRAPDKPNTPATSRLKLKMQRIERFLWLAAASLGFSVGLAGCADGPIPEMAALNPWVRQQWDEDEKFGPTFHTRLTELAAQRSRAASLSPAEQETLAAELVEHYRSERSTAMRVEILRTLAELPTYSAQTTLLEAITDAQPKIRMVACGGLGKRQCAESLEALGTAVGGDADLDVRLQAARALKGFHDPAAAQALSVALNDNDPALQRVAMESLGTITGRNYGTSVAAWREYLQGGDPTPPPGPTIAQRLNEYRLW